jgi:hypothetical protein
VVPAAGQRTTPTGHIAHPASLNASATLLRRTGTVPPCHVRPYFAVCAVESWHRVPVRQLADWSGIPLDSLRRRLTPVTLTPASVAAWYLSLHAAWLLDVAALPASVVVRYMQLGRAAALGAVLGARGVRFSAGSVEPGAFAAALDRLCLGPERRVRRMTRTLAPPRAEVGIGSIPVLIVADGERKRLAVRGSLRDRLLFSDRLDRLRPLLDGDSVSAVVIETRDADGLPVPAAIRVWAERNPLVPVVVWTAGGDAALREVLDLAVAGADARLVLRGRDDIGMVLDRLLGSPPPHPGAVPALLRGVVLAAPEPIQPALTLAVYQAWPRPSVGGWAGALHLTRQALNARLGGAGCATASAVMDAFSAAEIAFRCTQGMRLRDLAASMGRLDDRSLRRRLAGLGCKPEQLRDEADFRALIPRVAAAVRR